MQCNVFYMCNGFMHAVIATSVLISGHCNPCHFYFYVDVPLLQLDFILTVTKEGHISIATILNVPCVFFYVYSPLQQP